MTRFPALRACSFLAALWIAGCAATPEKAECDAKCIATADAKGEAVPLHRAQPVYPRVAAERGIGGCVVVSFVILPDGSADQYQVLDSQPEGLFTATTLQALNGWRFAQPLRKGRYAQTISYQIDDGKSHPAPICIETPSFNKLNPPRAS